MDGLSPIFLSLSPKPTSVFNLLPAEKQFGNFTSLKVFFFPYFMPLL